MFGRKSRRNVFERDVRIEIELLTKLHGENAAQIAAEKAARPTTRTRRRLVLEEAQRRLSGQAPQLRKGILTMIFG